ncbi:hypothetical protein ACH40E_37535 [Streptomyces acidicola]|uniref:hypothetical protein n=1 Tax=Streptomyces acidicola TaxID=2596892 RepID=UPI0037A7ABE2
MIDTLSGHFVGTACYDKYQLVTRSGGNATTLSHDRERSETIPFGIAAFRVVTDQCVTITGMLLGITNRKRSQSRCFP